MVSWAEAFWHVTRDEPGLFWSWSPSAVFASSAILHPTCLVPSCILASILSCLSGAILHPTLHTAWSVPSTSHSAAWYIVLSCIPFIIPLSHLPHPSICHPASLPPGAVPQPAEGRAAPSRSTPSPRGSEGSSELGKGPILAHSGSILWPAEPVGCSPVLCASFSGADEGGERIYIFFFFLF